jgi:hypothetical protein
MDMMETNWSGSCRSTQGAYKQAGELRKLK